jgi:uncharacterized protein YcgL (UPF0745 family)
MQCLVYRCARRAYTYLYLNPSLDWEDLPPELVALFQGAEQIMELELHPDRPLAQEDVTQVLKNLADPGYHLQLPPTEDPSGWLDLPSRPE